MFTTSTSANATWRAHTGVSASSRRNDEDPNGRPVGLENTFTTTAWGSGELTVTLRHLPNEDGQPTKVDGLAGTVAQDGFSAIGGDNDVQATFPITVE